MAEKVKMRLQGHEKFALREGWINKGLLIIPKNTDAFLRKDAPDIFGIGSNMVKSLRYWMKAFGLTVEKGSAGVMLSDMGAIIAEHDPYIENIFTLWLLHSAIAKNKHEATTWYMYFNHCDANDFDKTEIEAVLLREVKKYVSGQSFSEKSLRNDVDVLLNMYSKTKQKFNPEDKNISPFTRLALIKNVEGKYAKCHPDKRKFPELLVLYELAIMLKENDFISIEDAVYGENGLSNIYNFTSIMANEYFDRLDALGYIRVDRTAGLDMIYPIQALNEFEIIRNYYKSC